MNAVRRLILSHRRLAAAVMLAALCMRLLVLTGFMPTMADGTITVSICSGSGARTMAIALPGLADHDPGTTDHPASQMPCAFAGLGLASLAAVDPVVLAVAIAFVMARAPAGLVRVPSPRPEYLRPPLRGPPAAI